MKNDTRAKQSLVRVRSGIKLIVILLLAALVLYFYEMRGAAKILSVIAGFFTIVTLLEYLNYLHKSNKPP